MSDGPIPIPLTQPVSLDSSSLSSAGSSSLWDRISTWASEHKGIVYTIAGVTVVASGAGVVYYLSRESRVQGEETAAQKKSKKERRKAKKEAEEAAKKETTRAPEPAQPGRFSRASEVRCKLTESCQSPRKHRRSRRRTSYHK